MLNNSWQANGILFSLGNEEKCKRFQYWVGGGEKENKTQQGTPGHLLPKLITAPVLLFVKCRKWVGLGRG